MHLIYTPVYMYYLLLALKARAFVFFSAANPGIDLGGFWGESKMDILNKIPKEWIPKSLFVPKSTSLTTALNQLNQMGISFPIIAKPDVGERGFLVEKIHSQNELKEYRDAYPMNLVLQEFISEPEEVSILYYRYPGKENGKITSVTLKKFLTVTGNGHSTVRELIEAYPRARLQLSVLEEGKASIMQKVLEPGEELQLVPIGNHSRGTTFLNGNAHIDQELLNLFDRISHQLDGIYFGRFDIKCRSMAELKAGKNFYILEINGVKSEPTHIYQPGFSIWEAYKILFRQWRTIYEISMANHLLGVPFPGVIETIKRMRDISRYKKSIIG
ncbi:MAG: hypothetical protein AAF587_08310 [Bacteroidota bacterium]